MVLVGKEAEKVVRNGKWTYVVSRSALMVHRGTYMVGRLRTIDRGGDGGVAVGSSMVNLGVGLSLGFCTGGGGDKRQNLGMKAQSLQSKSNGPRRKSRLLAGV